MEGQAYPSKPNNVPIFSINRDFKKLERILCPSLFGKGIGSTLLHLGRWKYPWPQRELYDIAKDPNESTNLVEREPERAESMRQHILQELARHKVNIKEYQR